MVCCSYDLRICDYACELLHKLHVPRIVFTGNKGNWTVHLWDEPEARIFKKRALQNGIKPSVILTEEQATNIGENIAFTKRLIPEASAVTFVTKPNTILRVKLTVPVQWPNVTAYTSCPQFTFPEEVSNIIGVFGVINEMVGDIQRILEYPKMGYQVEHNLPPEVLNSWQYLVAQGFNIHRMESVHS